MILGGEQELWLRGGKEPHTSITGPHYKDIMSGPCGTASGVQAWRTLSDRPTGGTADRIQKLRKEYHQARREGVPFYDEDEGRGRPTEYDQHWSCLRWLHLVEFLAKSSMHMKSQL
uniref:Uncharacterized protein n=1 Tax=Sphaerodactylus townsendi TaxID=933632 RepID=A0ACB8G1K5_9SAUR